MSRAVPWTAERPASGTRQPRGLSVCPSQSQGRAPLVVRLRTDLPAQAVVRVPGTTPGHPKPVEIQNRSILMAKSDPPTRFCPRLVLRPRPLTQSAYYHLEMVGDQPPSQTRSQRRTLHTPAQWEKCFVSFGRLPGREARRRTLSTAATREKVPEAKHANRLPWTSARHAKGHHATPGGTFGLETAHLLVSGGGEAAMGPWVAKQLPCLGFSGSVPFSATGRRAGEIELAAVPQRGTVSH